MAHTALKLPPEGAAPFSGAVDGGRKEGTASTSGFSIAVEVCAAVARARAREAGSFRSHTEPHRTASNRTEHRHLSPLMALEVRRVDEETGAVLIPWTRFKSQTAAAHAFTGKGLRQETVSQLLRGGTVKGKMGRGWEARRCGDDRGGSEAGAATSPCGNEPAAASAAAASSSMNHDVKRSLPPRSCAPPPTGGDAGASSGGSGRVGHGQSTVEDNRMCAALPEMVSDEDESEERGGDGAAAEEAQCVGGLVRKKRKRAEGEGGRLKASQQSDAGV